MALSVKRRERLFSLALQAHRATGEGSLRQTFIAICRSIGSSALQAAGVGCDEALPEFLRQCCERGPWRVTSAQLWPAYNDWCRESGLAPAWALSMKRFVQLLKEQSGCRIVRERPKYVFQGLRLKDRENWQTGTALPAAGQGTA